MIVHFVNPRAHVPLETRVFLQQFANAVALLDDGALATRTALERLHMPLEKVLVDARGQIVGVYDARGSQRGFVRDANGAFLSIDPPKSIYTLVRSGAVNLAGAVTGTYRRAKGVDRVFLWTP